MHGQSGIAKPVAQFGDLGFIAVVEMLRRAEDFDGGDSGAFDAVEPGRSEAVVDDRVRGDHSGHMVSFRAKNETGGTACPT